MTVCRRKISACAFLMVLAFSTCFIGCNSQKEAVVKPNDPKVVEKQPDPEVEATFRTAELGWSDEKGRKVMDAKFKEASASHTDVSSTVVLRDVKAVLYAKGKAVAELTAPDVDIDNNTRMIKATGGVKVVSTSRNTTISADTIIWKSRENKLIGHGNVLMLRKNISAKAARFEADTSLRRARFKNAEIRIGGK